MDTLKLLTRSTNLKVSSAQNARQRHHLPSEGAPANPQVFHEPAVEETTNKKRKRDDVTGDHSDMPSFNFFGNSVNGKSSKPRVAEVKSADDQTTEIHEAVNPETWPREDCKKVLKEHKIKITNLTSLADQANPLPTKKSKKRKNDPPPNRKKLKEASRLYPQPVTSFQQLQPLYKASTTLTRNVGEQGYYVPTEVQLAALPLLLGGIDSEAGDKTSILKEDIDLLTVAPTGSGKTLAFLIPLIHNLSTNRMKERHVSAIILAPTKELVNQIVNEGRRLCAKTGIHITAMRKGMSLDVSSSNPDGNVSDSGEQSDDEDAESGHRVSLVKSDILVSTPLLLSNTIVGDKPMANIKYLVLDEADVLLDPLFRDQTMSVWNACTNPVLRTSFWSATIGASIEDLVKSTLITRQQALGIKSPATLIRLVIGLKDTSLPNISHRLVYAATEPGKLLGLRQLLHPSSSYSLASKGKSAEKLTTPILRPPFLVFTQTIERAIALHTELRYDIPLPAGGSSRIAVLHSDLSDNARADIMARFRKGQIWILITTDLLSRGIDFRGVNGVVNYDIPTSSAGYIHRAGRTGRAGRQGGVVITYYTKEDIPYIKNVANVIAASEKLRHQNPNTNTNRLPPSSSSSTIEDGGSSNVPTPTIQKWLLDALPTVSKKDRQTLKRRGVEARRSFNKTPESGTVDEKKKREMKRARIGTKSGFDKKMEERRRAAVEGSKRRKKEGNGTTVVDDGDGDEWGGFED